MLIQLKEIGQGLWNDETGAVVSAELAMVATLGVIGATVGLKTLSKSVNDELTDLAFAIRSLDQSFSVKQRRSAGACVAASCFRQADVKTAHQELQKHKDALESQQRKQLQRDSRKRDRDEDVDE